MFGCERVWFDEITGKVFSNAALKSLEHGSPAIDQSLPHERHWGTKLAFCYGDSPFGICGGCLGAFCRDGRDVRGKGGAGYVWVV